MPGMWQRLTTGVLGIRPREGISRGNLLAFYICSAFNVLSFVVVSSAQPNLLRILLADESEEEERRSGGVVDGTDNIGSITGDFVLVAEIVILSASGPWGVLSDNFGRRFVWSVGFMIMAIAFTLSPMAPSITTLLVVRGLHSFGAAAAASMMTPVLAEYILEPDKGKGAGVLGFTAAMGAVFGALFILRVPAMVADYLPPPVSPSSPNLAISVMYYVTSLLLIFASVYGFFCLSPEMPPQSRSSVALRGGRLDLLRWLKHYVADVWEVLQDSVLLLALLASFAGRGDASAITSLLPVWIVEYMREVKGSTAAEAAARSGMVTGFIQLSALFLSPFAGYLSDWLGDVAAVLVAGLSAGLAYSALGSITDPTGGSAFALALPLGLAEISVAITSQVIISRRGHPSKRGLLGALFSVFSSAGILFIGKAGGKLYDMQGPGAAFFVVAAMNFAVAVGASLIWGCKGENRLERPGGDGAKDAERGDASQEGEADTEALANPSHAL